MFSAVLRFCFFFPRLLFAYSVLLTFEIFPFHEDFHGFPFVPEFSLCSRLFSGSDFAFDLVFPLFFSVSPCLRASVLKARRGGSPWWILGLGSGSATLCLRVSVVDFALLPLAPLRRRNNRLCIRDVRRISHFVFPALHLGNQDCMLVLAIGIELDRPKRSHRQIQILDGIANFGAVSGFGVVDCLGGYFQRCIRLYGVVGGMRSIAFEELSVEFL